MVITKPSIKRMADTLKVPLTPELEEKLLDRLGTETGGIAFTEQDIFEQARKIMIQSVEPHRFGDLYASEEPWISTDYPCGDEEF